MNCLQDGKIVTFCPCAFPCIERDHVAVEEDESLQSLQSLQSLGAKR